MSNFSLLFVLLIKALMQSDIDFYVVRTVHFGIKLYNDLRNAQVFYLLIYLLLPYMFRAFV
jgi:hypothetical protein